MRNTRNTGKCNKKCDVFSAGYIFFQMSDFGFFKSEKLTKKCRSFGYPLFDGLDVSEILANNKKHINCNINEIIQSKLKKSKTNISQELHLFIRF